MNYPTTSIYPPFVQDATPVTPAAATVRPIPCVVLPPVERVGRFEQADRDQLLRVLNLAAAEKSDTAEVEESHIVPESDWLHAYNSAPDATAFGRARLRAKSAVA